MGAVCAAGAAVIARSVRRSESAARECALVVGERGQTHKKVLILPCCTYPRANLLLVNSVFIAIAMYSVNVSMKEMALFNLLPPLSHSDWNS